MATSIAIKDLSSKVPALFIMKELKMEQKICLIPFLLMIS
jgi:hypothetical protein